MSDPEGDRERPETNSPPDGAATAGASPLVNLNSVLVLYIASFLGVRDVISLRRCNKSLCNISRDWHLWRGLLRDLRTPLPRNRRSRPLYDLSCSDLEKATLDSLMTEDRWLRWREDRLTLLQMDQDFGTCLLDFLDDQWIISVPIEGLPVIWDARENPPKLCNLHKSISHFFQVPTVDAKAAADPSQDGIIITLRQYPPSTLQILQVHLGTGCLQPTAYPPIGNSSPGVIGLEPSRNSVITEIGARMQIIDWIRNRAVQITSPFVSQDYGSTRGVCLVGNYILSFRSKCIELLPIPPFRDANEQIHEDDPTFYRFHLGCQEGIFTGALLSEGQPNPESPNDSLVVYILAYMPDVSFFYFRVTIYNPHHVPSGPRARMDVDLLGVYDLSRTQTVLGEEVVRRVSSRAWLGPEGKRGLWIEDAFSREPATYVVAVSFDQNPSGTVTVESDGDLLELRKIAPKIRSICDVFRANIHDVKECNFSEATGKIVLKTADGIILL